MATPRVALQTYTVREELKQDFAGTLKAVARMGYPAIQPAGLGDRPAGEVRRLLDDLGLAVAGTHLDLATLENNLEEAVDYNLELGSPDLVLSALPNDRRGSGEQYRQVAAVLDRVGARCRQRGARLSYHNHAFEFERFDGQYGLDILLGSTDPANLQWEPDVYWIKYGGEDPAGMIRKYAGRCPLVHLKDMTADASRTFAEVGEGILDWPAIFAAAEAGAEWYIVEQDRWARPPLEAAALSLKHLRDWGKL